MNEEIGVEDAKPENAFDVLFGSRTRVKLLRLFLKDPKVKFFVRELVRLSGMQINAVRRELDNLLYVGIIKALGEETNEPKEKQKRFYQVDQQHVLFQEMQRVFIKGGVLMEKHILDEIGSLSTVKYLSVMGHFLGDEKGRTDIFLVGDISRDVFMNFVHKMEEDLGRELRFTMMSEAEFKERQLVMDQFLHELMSGHKYVVMNHLKV